MFEVPSSVIAAKARTRAYGTARRISAKPSMINILRNGSFIGDQRVRVEPINAPMQLGTRDLENADTYERMIAVFGVADHPVLVDFDVQVNDEFGVSGEMYQVIEVTTYPGEIQARCTRIQG